MRAASLLLAVLGLCCSRPQPERAAPTPPVAKTDFTVPSQGEAYALRFEDGALLFCDARGGRRLDLKSGLEAVAGHACAKQEPNAACAGLSVEASVRSPRGSPDDIVDAGGTSFPVEGRVRDCAAEERAIGVVTGAGLLLIDLMTEKTKLLSAKAHGRVVFGGGWMAWTEGESLRTSLRPTLR